MKKFELLQELPKHDLETWGEQLLLKNGADKTCTIQGCHKPSICLKKKNKTAVSAKCTKAKHNKMKYPCIVSLFGGHNSTYNTIPSKT